MRTYCFCVSFISGFLLALYLTASMKQAAATCERSSETSVCPLSFLKRNIQQHSWIVQQTKQMESRGESGGSMLSAWQAKLCFLIKMHMFHKVHISHFLLTCWETTEAKMLKTDQQSTAAHPKPRLHPVTAHDITIFMSIHIETKVIYIFCRRTAICRSYK